MQTNTETKTTLMPGDKYCLTVQEAASYFEIGEKKIRELATTHMEDGIFCRHGVKLLIIRPRFEDFLTHAPEI